jgi:hypothetical protein
MAATYSNGGNRWNILGFNFTKRDALSSVYKISMLLTPTERACSLGTRKNILRSNQDCSYGLKLKTRVIMLDDLNTISTKV